MPKATPLNSNKSSENKPKKNAQKLADLTAASAKTVSDQALDLAQASSGKTSHISKPDKTSETKTSKNVKAKYMLIDGNALVHRGYHAIPVLSNKDGVPTNAVYGFAMILLRAISSLKPTHIACAFDLAGPTFRHKEYEHYKATRAKGDDELYAQFPLVKKLVRALNIPIFEIEGFEADDVLGTLSHKICEHQNGECDVMIVTGDLDSLQLVNECVKIYTLKQGINDTAVYDTEAIQNRYGLLPEQMIDYKALRGDPSDNIKGVKGIGEKTASELIQNFGSLKNLYDQIKSGKAQSKVKPRVLKLLEEGEVDAVLSYRLSKIVCDVPIKTDIDKYSFDSEHLRNSTQLFRELEFKSLLDKLPKNYFPNKLETAASQSISANEIAQQELGKQKYELIDNHEKLEVLNLKLAKQKLFVLDTETDQLNPMTAKVIGISICFKEGEAYYIPSDVFLKNQKFLSLLEDKHIAKIGHNIKYDLLALQNSDVSLGGISFDTMIASYLLNAGTRKHSLDALAFSEFGYQMQPIEDLIGKGKSQISMADVDINKVSWYACEDADFTFRLYQILSPKLKDENLQHIFSNLEIPLIEVLARMEREGIEVDSGLLEKLSSEAKKQIYALEKDIYNLAGEEFNIGSPKQLQEILFFKLGLESGKKNKTGLSTAAGELERLLGQHPIIEKILLYRELAKLDSTYLEALPKLIEPHTGRIHTSYNQTIAATGRLSSTDPNLQNIPIRGSGLGSEIRKAFVAAKGFELVSIDYSQMELRIVAHLAGDVNMKSVFKNSQDIHTNTAMAVFDVPQNGVTEDMRRDAKTINFGILYGLSSFGLASRINSVSRMNAKEFIDKYFEEYSGVKDYLESVKAEVREFAQVKNEAGRVRKFPEIQSTQFFVRAAAERAAINFPIQSLQADIIKMAMLEIDKQIFGKSKEIKMLLQVHDELVFEIASDKVESWAKKIKQIMQDSYQLSVPVVAEAKAGKNWGEMHKLAF